MPTPSSVHQAGPMKVEDEKDNAFCPTGQGGGVDPSCGKESGGGSGGSRLISSTHEGVSAQGMLSRMRKEGKGELAGKASSVLLGKSQFRDLDAGDKKAIGKYMKEAGLGELGRRNGLFSLDVSLEEVRSICPPCAEKMSEKSIVSLVLDPEKPNFGLPEGTSGTLISYLERKYAMGETHNIEGVEVFASGTWNGDKYSEKDLDAIVEAFGETKATLRPYLKLGHSEEQKLLSEDELPAAGWVTNLYRKGNKVLADFSGMPSKIFELVRSKAYNRVSSELFVGVKVGDKKYPYALKAVALLGGETPAVHSLDEIHALYALDAEVLRYGKEAEVRHYEFDSANEAGEVIKMAGAKAAPEAEPDTECTKQLKSAREEMETMRKKMSEAEAKVIELTAKVTETEGEVAKFKSENETLKTEAKSAKDGLGKAEAELVKFHSERRQKEAKATVEKLVNEKKVLPAQAAILETILLSAKETQVKKFKAGEQEFASAEDLILAFVDKGGAGLPTEPKTEGGKTSAVADPENGEQMDAAVKTYMEKNGEKSYRKAYLAVSKELRGTGNASEPKKT